MNNRQKIVQQRYLDNEEAVIKKLESTYKQSLKEIEAKSRALQADINALQDAFDTIDDDAQKAIIKSMQQSKIYQKQYQDALKLQISSVLDNMQVNEFKTVADYLQVCYEEGFIGTMYDLEGQGIPLIMPIDQEAMVRAVQLDSKISEGLYTRLGEDVKELKKKIASEVSRGISTGESFANTALRLSAISKTGLNNAIRIARTEGHRVQVQSSMDACYKASEKGAEVVKQWDATQDRRTRKSHAKVDGEIRELDEPFSNGLMFPSDPNGIASEVVNCRCALLQRSKWALDDAELDTLKQRATFFGLDKTDSFDDFKKKYLASSSKVTDTQEIKSVLKVGELSKDEFQKWENSYYKANNVTLTDKEAKAIYDYGEGGYSLLNAYGRYGEGSEEFNKVLKQYGNPDIATVKDRFNTVETALNKFSLDDDILVHRAIRDVSYITDDISAEGLKNLAGKEVTEKGFTSTSFAYQSKFTGKNPNAVHMEMVLPKGTNGAYIDKYVSKDEQEFLLNANTKYKILDGGERTVKETKFDFKTRSFIEVDKTEKYLKVQVIKD